MSGPLDTLEWLPEAAAPADAPAHDGRSEPGLADQLLAGVRVEVDRVEDVQALRRARAYEPLIDALVERGVDRASLAEGQPGLFGIGRASGGAYRYDQIWREARRLGIGGLPASQRDFEQQAYRRGGERDADLQTLARGGGAAGTAAQFAGAMIGSFADPINVYTLPLGGGGKTIASKLLTEGLIGAGTELAQVVPNARAYERMGEDYGVADAALDVAAAGGGAMALRGAGELVPHVDAAGYRAAAPLRERFDRFFQERDLARAFARQVPPTVRTPQQEAALHVLTREAEIDADSPFERSVAGDAAHREQLERASEQVAAARFAPEFDMNRFMARNRAAESAGNDAAAAGSSSAFGRYQFLGDTWLSFYRQTFGNTGESAEQILAKRADGRVQDRVMRTFTQANVDALRRAGQRVDDGTVYLAHFLGIGDALRVLRARPDTPVARVVDRAAIAANPGVFRGIGSASELVAWARRTMGQRGVGVPAVEDDYGAGIWDGIYLDEEFPLLRPSALDAERPIIGPIATSVGRAIPTAQFAPADIAVDAELMQFKSGGDAQGVTERLQGIGEWDPIAAGMVTVWEAQDGRRLIADGHQRLGLANRLVAGGGEPPMLNAFVLREADGFSATDARVLTALKNIGEGTGSAADAAKVLRAVGEDGDGLLRRLPPRSALVRDGKALARLSDEAFGAIVNEVIPEQYGAAIGALAPDRDTHLALVELLAATDPPNRRQAEAILRQAIDAGFTREVQDELFGPRDLVRGLYAERAKLLDRSLGELRRLKGAFGVAARNADVLDAAGNRIDVAASEAAADSNARALALVEALALRKGNAVNELLDAAAQRIAAGEPLARVTRELVAGIRALDINSLERVGGPGDAAAGSGRAGEPGGEAAGDPGEGLDTDGADDGPGLFDDPASSVSRAFDSDDGEGVQAASDSLWHDIRAAAPAQPTSASPSLVGDLPTNGVAPANVAEDGTIYVGAANTSHFHVMEMYPAVRWGGGTGFVTPEGQFLNRSEALEWVNANGENIRPSENMAGELDALDYREQRRRVDPNIAALERQRAQLGAQAPMRATAEQDGTMGTPLFDAADEPTFDLDDGKGARTVAEIEAEIDAERAAIEAIKGCLK